ncbi:hypothetical protein [Embleya sp. NPDC059237]|uniref:hypothetical protein n=1 Tax=Embleya sp. NPDC059237 TaxID=3346784 RepID=UPI0036A34D52
MSPQTSAVPDAVLSDVAHLERALEQMRTDLLARMEDLRGDLRRMVSEDLWRAEQRLDQLRMDHLAEGLRRVEAAMAVDREAAERYAREADVLRKEDRARTEATRRLVWSTLVAPLLVAVLVWLATTLSK